MVDFDTTYDGEPAFDTHQAAEFTGRSYKYLCDLRHRNTKPHFVKRGARTVLYKEIDLLNFLAAVQDFERLVLRLHERIEAGRSNEAGRGNEGDREWLERLCREYGIEAPSPGEKGDVS